MKKVLSVLLVVCALFSLCACGGNDDTAEKEVLTMATEATFEPFEYYDGDEIVGIDVDIAEAIAEKLGMELEVTDIAFDSIVPSVQAGKYDIGAAGMTITDERLEQINFTEAYYTEGVQVVIVKEDSPITDVADLFKDGANNVVGTQSGTTGFDSATEQIDGKYGTVKAYDKTTDAALALVKGSIDCIILDNEPAKAIVKNNEGLKILDTEYAKEEYAICVSKDNAELYEKVNSALKELIADGTVANIIANYTAE